MIIFFIIWFIILQNVRKKRIKTYKNVPGPIVTHSDNSDKTKKSSNRRIFVFFLLKKLITLLQNESAQFWDSCLFICPVWHERGVLNMEVWHRLVSIKHRSTSTIDWSDLSAETQWTVTGWMYCSQVETELSHGFFWAREKFNLLSCIYEVKVQWKRFSFFCFI